MIDKYVSGGWTELSVFEYIRTSEKPLSRHSGVFLFPGTFGMFPLAD